MYLKYLRYYHSTTVILKDQSNIQLSKELPFYGDFKNKTAFSGYAQIYKVEIIDKRDVIV